MTRKYPPFIITSFLFVLLVLAACSGFPNSVHLNTPTAQTAAQVKTRAVIPITAAPTEPLPSATSTPASPAAVQPVVDQKTPLSAPVVVAPGADVITLQTTLEGVFQALNSSVVSIQVVSPPAVVGFGRRRVQPGPSIALGSGMVWDTQGHIVTNNHVVTGATSISVTFADHTTVDASLVGADPNSDLAVIQVNVPAAQLHPVQWADSTQVQVGQIAIAIGNPFGLQNTATLGIISGLDRTLSSNLDTSNPQAQSGPSYTIPNIIQTDASINPGNSGGVLVDIQGQVIGIPSAIESPTQTNAGVGFVIPSAIVQKVVPVLIQQGSYQDPWIGIDGTDLSSAINKTMGLKSSQQGALVTDVASGSAADQAGLQGGSSTITVDGTDVPVGGDVITAINGQAISQFNALLSYLFIHTNPGEKVTLTVLRGGKTLTIPVTVGAVPAP